LSIFGGVVQHCLYDRTKLVVLGLTETGQVQWNAQFLDFALRLGFDIRLCQGYRPQTKERAESGIKLRQAQLSSGVRFTDLDDLGRQARVWPDTVANVRRERPIPPGRGAGVPAPLARPGAAAAVAAGGAAGGP
jgi:transposase